MKKTKILALLLFAVALAGVLAGCNDFERTSFQSLSASKAVIDQAQADYESRALPQTQASYTAITKAKQAQTAAVDALLAYESIKSAKGSATALQAQQQLVGAAIAQIPALIADIKALTSSLGSAPAPPVPAGERTIPPPPAS